MFQPPTTDRANCKRLPKRLNNRRNKIHKIP
jgi:hypothetical protein